MKVETLKVDSLHLDPANVRKHGERNLDAIKASLARFGQMKPIVVDAKGVVIAGNGTLAAAKALGWDKVQAVRSPLKGVDATAYAIADNRTAELAEWDDKALAETLRAVQSDPSIDLAVTGFDEDELAALIAKLGDEMLGGGSGEDPGAEPDRAEELRAKWATEPGQLWAIPSLATPGKEHRLLCGDSTKAEDVARVMGGEKADLLLTDPPYGINASNMTLGNGKKGFHRGKDWDKSRPAVVSFLTLAEKAIIWGGNYFAAELPVSNDWLCWHKKFEGVSFSEFELAWTNLGKNCRHLSHHWSGEHKDHPTQKPLPVFVWCLEQSDAVVVLDVFCGSGTTIVAAEQTGRLCRAVEQSPEYVAVALERLAGMGLKPYPSVA